MRHSYEFYEKRGFDFLRIHVGGNLLARKLVQEHIMNVWGIYWAGGHIFFEWETEKGSNYIFIDHDYSKTIEITCGTKGSGETWERRKGIKYKKLSVGQYFKKFGVIE